MQTATKTVTTEFTRLYIPISYSKFLRAFSSNEERVFEVVLVYNGLDRWDTVIEPQGLNTRTDTVTVDYNHRNVDTGAYIRNVREAIDYEIEGINGEVKKLPMALIADLHIPKHAELYYFDKEGGKRSNGNLYDAVEKNLIKSVSIEFKPVKQKTDTRTGITTYTLWDLIRVSVLDTTAGQPFSGLKQIRFLSRANMPKLQELLTTKLQDMEVSGVIENLSVLANFDVDGKPMSAILEMSDDMSEVSIGEITSPESSSEDEESEDERKDEAGKEPEGEPAPSEGDTKEEMKIIPAQEAPKEDEKPAGEPKPAEDKEKEEMRGVISKLEERLASLEAKQAEYKRMAEEQAENESKTQTKEEEEALKELESINSQLRSYQMKRSVAIDEKPADPLANLSQSIDTILPNVTTTELQEEAKLIRARKNLIK